MTTLDALLAVGIFNVLVVAFGAGGVYWQIRNNTKVLADHVNYEEQYRVRHEASEDERARHVDDTHQRMWKHIYTIEGRTGTSGGNT